jgi:hypothetical protein
MTTSTTASDLTVSRSVHSAMAKTVSAFGILEAQDMYKTASRFNDEFFGGILTAIMVEITTPGSPSALATHEPRTPEGVDCVVRVSPSVVMASKELAHDVLLHEMIHVWQAETENREPGYAGHGPKFAAKCNEIGSKLGLNPVSVKGKEGLPDCAQWPLNVRPDGYYGASVRATKAVARATKARKTAAKTPKAPKAKRDMVAEVLALLAEMSPEEREIVKGALDSEGLTVH